MHSKGGWVLQIQVNNSLQLCARGFLFAAVFVSLSVFGLVSVFPSVFANPSQESSKQPPNILPEDLQASLLSNAMPCHRLLSYSMLCPVSPLAHYPMPEAPQLTDPLRHRPQISAVFTTQTKTQTKSYNDNNQTTATLLIHHKA